ncbi:MAG: DNA repair protein RecN [Marinifilaceae bacterium]|jgi:DNA repair protein RecN (Recombination protein N)|nr:DNA repair protein RecN [Marinifilaceae bacterium]
MIKSIYIKNYALISELDINFDSGFSVITGETGAGKSILLGAIGLAMGNRIDTSILKDKNHKCIIELSLDISKYNYQNLFKEYDLDYDQLTIIRREILPNGKSRAYINDSPINIKNLKLISEYFIDIHSQNQNLQIADEDFQTEIIDLFANTRNELNDYHNYYCNYLTVKSDLKKAIDLYEKEKNDLDYIQFQFNQLDEANLSIDEQQLLEEEQNSLANAEEIKSCLSTSFNFLEEEEAGILSLMNRLKQNMLKLNNILPQAEELNNRIESSFLELQDLSSELENINSSLEMNPERLEFVNDRLNTIYNLEQKHKVDNLRDLLAIKDNLADRINKIETSDDNIKELEIKLEKTKEILLEKALILSKKRKEKLPNLHTDINKHLKELGIKHANFQVDISNSLDFKTNGLDQINFLFSANKGGSLEKLGKIASGGELSRIMLSMKYIIGQKKNTPSILFDEIDTGVSGEIADKMANIMSSMSNSTQVISITHLPQIAGQAKTHFKVYKADDEEQTYSNIVKLNKDERLEELAKMLSGSKITQAALENAKELLK